MYIYIDPGKAESNLCHFEVAIYTSIYSIHIISGWWFQPLKNMKVSWGYYSQYMEIYIYNQTTNQICIDIVVSVNPSESDIIQWVSAVQVGITNTVN